MVWSAKTQTMRSPSPTRSIGSLRVGVSRLLRPHQQTAPQKNPKGTLIRKIQLQ